MSRSRTFAEALTSVIASEGFRQFRLPARAAFLSAYAWLEPKARDVLPTNVSASLARNWRDQAARTIGWRRANTVLRLVQVAVAVAVEEGAITKNRVRNIPLLPPQWPNNDKSRRVIHPSTKPHGGRRHPLANGDASLVCGKTSTSSYLGKPDDPPAA